MSKKKKKLFDIKNAVNFEVTEIDAESGDLVAQPINRQENPYKLRLYINENRRIRPALEVGDCFIGKVAEKGKNYVVKPVVRNERANAPLEKVYGVVNNKDGRLYVLPAERSNYNTYLLDAKGKSKPKDGDFVCISLSGSRKFKTAKIVKNFGPYNVAAAASGILLEKYDVPYIFPSRLKNELDKLPQYDENCRQDLTSVPLVTIDGEDSKDFDDAVWAEETPQGFNLMVAIADVAFYVRHLSDLDREAYKRGNSVYLPQTVVPMLPELLSNDLCSLRPKENRPALVCFMQIDKSGNIKNFDFTRAVIKSAARLTYREVQEALDGKKITANIKPVFNTVIKPIYAAFEALEKDRLKRGALNIETTEVNVKVDKNGVIQSIAPTEIFTAHRIIEDFMVAANVSAARALGKTELPAMYRIHDRPTEEKLKDIEPICQALKLKLPEWSALRPEHLNKIIELCGVENRGINDAVLRLQCQAQYSPHNIGHFGLGLSDYVHFTSPIRRYADLLVHRALIKAFKMPDGGALDDASDEKLFEEIGTHLSETERRAVNLERDVVARYLSSYLEPSIGQDFEVQASGFANAGMFVEIESLGAEGLVPMSSLPDDDYTLMSGNAGLRGEIVGREWHVGDKLICRLMEATPLTGGLIFKFVDSGEGVDYFEKGRGRRRKPQAENKEMKPTEVEPQPTPKKKRAAAVKKSPLSKTGKKCSE